MIQIDYEQKTLEALRGENVTSGLLAEAICLYASDVQIENFRTAGYLKLKDVQVSGYTPCRKITLLDGTSLPEDVAQQVEADPNLLSEMLSRIIFHLMKMATSEKIGPDSRIMSGAQYSKKEKIPV